VASEPQGVSKSPDAVVGEDRVTRRSVTLGVLTIVVTAVYITHYGGNLIKGYVPVAALLPFVAWVGINAALKVLAPRQALSRTEVLTILVMVWIVGNLPATGWAGYIISDIAAPEHFASPENRVRDVAMPYLPDWLFLRESPYAVGGLFAGLPAGDPIPWSSWVRPLFWWLAGCLSAVMAGFYGSVLFYKQWHEKERLTFPMATFPADLLAEREGGRLPPALCDRLFWIGFAVTAGIICWNIGGYFVHTLPRIGLFDHVSTRVVHVGRHYPNYYLRVQPLIMGLAYLCPLDLLFSFWFYNLVNILQIGRINRTGFSVGLQGQQASAREITMLESHGALFFLVAWSLWVSRKHLMETLRSASGDLRQDDGRPVSYRTAWLGLGAAVFFLGAWMVAVGMDLLTAIVQLVLMFVCFFGVTKYAAATGFTFLDPAGRKGTAIIRAIGGTASLSPGSQTTMWILDSNAFLALPIRVTSILPVAHYFRMLGDGFRRHPLIARVVPLAFVVGFAATSCLTLHRSYTEGGLNGPLYLGDWRTLVRMVPEIEGSKLSFFDPQKLAVWALGAAMAGLLTYLRARFAWWPFHPAAVAFPIRFYGFSLFLVWLAKTVVMRIGGVSLYRKSLPFWYGFMMGYLFGVGLSTVVDAIWFPDQGHWVHGW
jgi:hypothetical protein